MIGAWTCLLKVAVQHLAIKPMSFSSSVRFQVFLSNTNIYMVSYYLIIVICLHAVIWFQVTINNP